MIDKSDVTEDLLQQYIDGKLDAVEKLRIENYLEKNPDELERISVYLEQNDLMGTLYHHADEELLHRVEDNYKNSDIQKQKHMFSYVANFTWVVIGILIGFNLNTVNIQSELAQYNLPHRAMVSHRVFTPEVLHPVEVRAKQEKHLTAWLSKRLDRKLIIPSLDLLGYALVGGRLLAAKDGPAAQFMYENSTGDRLTFYVTASGNNNTAFKLTENNNTKVFSWNDESIGFAVVGNVKKEFLLKAAGIIYQDYAF